MIQLIPQSERDKVKTEIKARSEEIIEAQKDLALLDSF